MSLVPGVLYCCKSTESSPFSRTARGLCLSPCLSGALSLSSVRVLLLLLPCETGQPGAEQHGSCRPGPCAVIRPADLAGTCGGEQRVQDDAFSSFSLSVYPSAGGISAKTRERISLKFWADKPLAKEQLICFVYTEISAQRKRTTLFTPHTQSHFYNKMEKKTYLQKLNFTSLPH